MDAEAKENKTFKYMVTMYLNDFFSFASAAIMHSLIYFVIVPINDGKDSIIF